MPPDMVLHPRTGTVTVTSLRRGVISSIGKALPLAAPVPRQARAVEEGWGGQEEQHKQDVPA